MIAEWVALIALVWQAAPAGVVAQLGDPSYVVRERTQRLTLVLPVDRGNIKVLGLASRDAEIRFRAGRIRLPLRLIWVGGRDDLMDCYRKYPGCDHEVRDDYPEVGSDMVVVMRNDSIVCVVPADPLTISAVVGR